MPKYKQLELSFKMTPKEEYEAAKTAIYQAVSLINMGQAYTYEGCSILRQWIADDLDRHTEDKDESKP